MWTIVIVATLSAAIAPFARAAVQILVAYLALRRSAPSDRTAILKELATVFRDLDGPDRRVSIRKR
jgi:hypothetical protein